MSGATNLPFPKVRELWIAQSGVLFFIKWMLAAVLGTHFVSACVVFVVRTGIDPGKLCLAVPVFIQACVVFGFCGRTWVWAAVHLLVAFTVGNTPVSLTLQAIAEALLLLGIRRQAGMWLLASAAAHTVGFVISRTRPGDRWINDLIMALPINGIGQYWALVQTSQTVELCVAATLGAALAWLMPPVNLRRDQKAELEAGVRSDR
jgi:hypothetical protein